MADDLQQTPSSEENEVEALDQPLSEEAISEEPEAAEAFDQDTYAATQGLIARLGMQLDDLSGQLKQQREMLGNVFENDEELQVAEQKAEEVKAETKSRREKINEAEEVITIKSKIAEISEDIKMVKESLNTHLLTYYQMTGSTSVDMPDGSEREFKINAVLKPRKN